MIRPAGWAGLLAIPLLVLAWGCPLPGGPDPFREERKVLEGLGTHLNRELSFGEGQLMGLARMFSKDEELQSVAEMVQGLDVSIYKIQKGHRPGRPEFHALAARKGWSPVIRIHNGGENVLVLAREKGGDLSELFIAVLDDDELVMTRWTGNLENALSQITALTKGKSSGKSSPAFPDPSSQPEDQASAM